MKFVFCSKCNSQLPITRKALKEFGVIVDLVEPHECPTEPLPFPFNKNPLPHFVEKSVQKPNKLPTTGTDDLRDRRTIDQVRSDSTAPRSLLDQFRDFQSSIPDKEPTND